MNRPRLSVEIRMSLGGILTSIRNVPPNEALRQTGRDHKAKRQIYKMADGGGLYLEVSAKCSKYWRMKYRRPSDKKRIASLLVFGLL